MADVPAPGVDDDIVISRVHTPADVAALDDHAHGQVRRRLLMLGCATIAFAAVLKVIYPDPRVWLGNVAILVIFAALALSVGTVVGLWSLKKVVRSELGGPAGMRVTWGRDGLVLESEFARFDVPWSDMRSVGRRKDVWEVRLRWVRRAFSNRAVVALPGDFVTPAVLEKVRAAGVTVR